jgi:anti-sigma B factor antagonist
MKSEIKNGVLVVYLEGNLMGLQINDPLVNLIKSSIEAGNKKVLFNMAEMKFMGSTGLGMLLTTLLKTRRAGGEMALCSVPEQMHELLQITKLDTVFNQQPDEESALKFLAG